MKLVFLFARTFLFKVVNALLGFIVILAFTTYYVTPAGRGIYSDLTIYVGVYAVTLGGFANYISFAINRLKTPLDKILPLGTYFYGATSLLTLLILPFMVYSGFLTSNFEHQVYLIMILSGPFVVQFGYYSRVLNALNRIDVLNWLNLVQVVSLSIMFIALWFLPKPPTDQARTLLICWLWLVSNAISGIASRIAVKKITQVKLSPKWDATLGKELFQYGGTMAVGNLAERANVRFSYMMVDSLNTLNRGIYSVALTAAEALTFISSSVSTIVYTRIAGYEWGESRRITEAVFRVMMVATVLTALFGAAVAPFVFHIFHKSYAAAIAPFFIQLIGLALAGPRDILMSFFTNQMKNPRLSIYSDLMAIAVSAPVCLILIPKYGMVGAAWGSTAAYASQFLASYLYYEWKVGKGSLFKFSKQDWRFLRRNNQAAVESK